MDAIARLALVLVFAAAQAGAGSFDPQVFAPGIVSTAAIEDAVTFSPDGDLAVFSRRAGKWGEPAESGTLFQTRRTANGWTQPEPLPFSGRHDDGDPAFSPDGRRLHFVSSRAAPDGRRDPDLWFVERNEAGWGEPEHLGGTVNSPAAEYSPSVTAQGRLYFASMRDGGLGQGDLWVADRAGRGYGPPRNLGPVLNSAGGEWNVTVAPDESFLVFEASGRPTNRSVSGDLYASYRTPDGWSAPIALDPINTVHSELNARLSPDGSRLFFVRSTTADEGAQADILSVPAERVLPHLASPDRPRAAVVSRSAHEVFVLEAGDWRTLARLPTGRGPHEIAIAPDGRTAYTADYGVYPKPHAAPVDPAPPQWIEEPSGSITVLDLVGMRRARTIRLTECRRNHGILVAGDGRRIWTTCEEEGAVLEIDAAGGDVLRRFKTATGSHQLASTPGDTLLIASNVESGSVSLISVDDGAVATLRTGPGAEGLAVSPDGRWLWVGNASDHTVTIVDLRTRGVAQTIGSGGRFPVKLAFDAAGQEVWVVNTASRSIAVFGAATRELVRNLEFDSPPLGILAAPDGGAMLVSFPRLSELAVLSTVTGQRLATVRGIVEADGIAWIPGRVR